MPGRADWIRAELEVVAEIDAEPSSHFSVASHGWVTMGEMVCL